MNTQSDKIITPRNAELISSDSSVSKATRRLDRQLQAKIQYNNISETRLTCCNTYKHNVICAGFSGMLYFVDGTSLIVLRKEKITNSIIRCMKVIDENIMIISTDAGEIIPYDLEHNKILYYEHSASSVYIIAVASSRKFYTGEKNGDIIEWQFIPGEGVVRNRRVFTCESPVFAMDIIGQKLVVTNSLGTKFEYGFSNANLKKTSICKTNVFCLKEGKDASIYYGLSTGAILYEESGCDITVLDSHQDAVRDLTFSTLKEWMFSISKDRTVKAWHNGISRIITRVKDYLYQIIFEESNACLYYVDGHGDIGAIHFSSDIDSINSVDCIDIVTD